METVSLAGLHDQLKIAYATDMVTKHFVAMALKDIRGLP